MMAGKPNDWQELDRLMDGACDRTLTSQEWLTLSQWLIDSPEARDRYMACMNVHGTLALQIMPGTRLSLAEMQQFAAAENNTLGMDGDSEAHAVASASSHFILSDAVPRAQSWGFSSGWAVAYLVATVVFAVGLGIGALVHVSQPGQLVGPNGSVQTPDPQAPGSNPSFIVGRISGMVDCVWEGAGFRVQRGGAANQKSEILNQKSLLHLGDRLALRSGLLEITYDTGACVVLQGPVTYEVESPAGGYLSVGKLTAKLENGSEVGGRRLESANQKSESMDQKFAVRTPTAIVTDLGTEFCVEVQKDGLTFAHVFRGTVEVCPVASSGQPGKAVQLSANDSVQVAGGGSTTVRHSQAEPADFVRVEQARHLMERPKSQPFERWQAQAEAIRRDPALVVYYDFQRHADSPDVLHAEANGAGSKLDGIIEGAVWAKGRIPGKDALRFDGSQSCVRVKIPQRFEAMTLATWISITSASDVGCAVLAPDGWGDVPGLCNVQIVREGNIHFDTTGFGVARTGPVLPWQEWSKKRWRHLAVVVDPAREQVRWFLDSGKVYDGPIDKNFFAAFESASIGNWWSTRSAYERGFGGRMDELLILGRVMTEQEVRGMYEAGKP